MKKVFMLLLGFMLLGLTSCLDMLGIELEEEDELVLTNEDVENAAMGTVMAGYTSVKFLEEMDENGPDALEAEVSGLTIVDTATTATLTFLNVGVDFEGDDVIDIYIDGAYTVDDDTMTITYTNYRVTNGENTTEYVTINGTTSITEGTTRVFTSVYTISGSLLSEELEVATIMSMSSGGGDPSFTSATINGTDYLIQFNQAIEDM